MSGRGGGELASFQWRLHMPSCVPWACLLQPPILHRLAMAPCLWQWPCDFTVLSQPRKRQLRRTFLRSSTGDDFRSLLVIGEVIFVSDPPVMTVQSETCGGTAGILSCCVELVTVVSVTWCATVFVNGVFVVAVCLCGTTCDGMILGGAWAWTCAWAGATDVVTVVARIGTCGNVTFGVAALTVAISTDIAVVTAAVIGFEVADSSSIEIGDVAGFKFGIAAGGGRKHAIDVVVFVLDGM